MAISSIEAEYKAACEAIWLRKLLGELGLPQIGSIVLGCDNQSCIAIAKNTVFHAQMKDIEIQYHYVHERALAGDLCLEYCPMADNARVYKCLPQGGVQENLASSSSTSRSSVSIRYQEERDQVGIGGSWDDFLQYIRAAFSSENVKFILGGPASAIGGQGATSAKVVAQKSKGMPRISLTLEKLAGPFAEDVMGLISVELLRAYRIQSNALETEQKAISQLKESLARSKEETRMLQEQVDATGYRGKRRGRMGATQFSADAIDASISQFDANNGITQDTSGTQAEDSKPKTTGRAVPLRNKVHLAHAKRAKQRGSRLADPGDD